MAYSNNILPKSAAYYTLSNASIVGTELNLNSGGFAEIQVSAQMLPRLTSKMLIVAHPSVFSNNYTNDAVQITISIRTTTGSCIEYLIPIVYDKSGVFNTEIELPEEEYVLFTYRISSKVPVVLYNWELCAEQAADLTTVIDGVEQSLPKLLYDYNTYSYAVSQKELTVGLISCYLLDSTDLQGHFTLSFFATERCNIHVRIKDNGTTELFSPQVYTVERGYASISIPHAYLHKTATEHAFSVTVQCTNGQISIPVRGMLYTIDGGYLATRLLDAGIDTIDISIKQTEEDDAPSEIWAIGFEGNRLLVKSREYSQLQRANWTAVKDLGEGTDAAIEFSGSWFNKEHLDRYTIYTQGSPHAFVVDLSGNLVVYSGEHLEQSFILDTEVSKVAACQGFNSMYDIEQDQGLVVVYIKNGNVYYRQLAYSVDNTVERTWLAAYELYTDSDASFVSMHRLPDYRIGICVMHANGTKWYITDRTYVSQGFKPEIFGVDTNSFTLASVFDADRAPSTVAWPAKQNVFAESTHYNGFVMTFDGPLEFLHGGTINDLIDNLTVRVNSTVLNKTDIKSIVLDSNIITVTLKNAIRGNQTVTIDYNCFCLVMRAYNGALATIKQSYSWTLLLPTTTLTYNDSASVNVSAELNARVRQSMTLYGAYNENAYMNVTPTLNLAVKPIKTINVPYKELPNVNVVASLNLAILQTGSTPL